MLQLLLWCQTVTRCGQFRGQVRRGDGDARIGVGDVVLELLHPVHGIDRHHHRIQSQDGKVRDHQLRAVLHVQDHAVALVHPQGGQITGQFFRFVLERGVSPGLAHDDQR